MAKKKIEQEAETAPVAEVKQYFETVMWKDVKEVFRCLACGENRDDVDNMILHVLTHLPQSEQEEILEQLIEEK